MVTALFLLSLFVSLFLHAPAMAECPSAAVRATFSPRSENTHKSCQSVASETKQLCEDGKTLFSSTSLSHDGKVACITCHQTQDSQNFLLSDGKQRAAPRRVELIGPRTPSLLDVGRTNGPFFWNGRASTLGSQPFWPLYNPDELGSSPEHLEKFGGSRYVARALEAFMTTLQSGEAPVDRWLRGDCEALSESEQSGAQIVLSPTCTRCHSGTEFRGTQAVAMAYFNLSSDLFARKEASYSADADLAAHRGGKFTRLKTVPPTLRNLDVRQNHFGRFGQHKSLESFLQAHGKQPENQNLHFTLSQKDFKNTILFLRVGLTSDEFLISQKNKVTP